MTIDTFACRERKEEREKERENLGKLPNEDAQGITFAVAQLF